MQFITVFEMSKSLSGTLHYKYKDVRWLWSSLTVTIN